MSGPHAKPAPFRPALEAASEAARCKVAAELFDIQAMKAAMVRVADTGVRVCIFRPALPLDLRGTPAAIAFEKWASVESLGVEWGQPESVTDNGTEIGRRVSVTVSWDTPRIVPA